MIKIKVVVVDDSNIIHALLNMILGSIDDITIIGNARDGQQGIDVIKETSPDVIIMDITMPGMSGLEAIRNIMDEKPTPIIVFSAASKSIVNLSFQAIDLGAVEIIEKPETEGIAALQQIIKQKLVKSIRTFADFKVIRRIKESAVSRLRKKYTNLSSLKRQPGEMAVKSLPEDKQDKPYKSSFKPDTNNDFLIVGIASSTGGPQTIKYLLSSVSHKDAPCSYIIVQHLAMGFLKGFCDWINDESRIPVEIAANGEYVHPRKIYMAPEGHHLRVNKKQQFVYNDDPPVLGIRPSADVLFESLGPVFKKRVIAIVLTGMGSDGSRGIRSIKNNGGYVMVQDESSSYIFGMPKAAIETGVTDRIVSIYEMPNFLERLFRERYTKS